MIRESRKLTAILAIALVAVWGAVVYRVVKAVDGPDADVAVSVSDTAPRSASGIEFHYQADVRDLFAYFPPAKRDSVKAKPKPPEPPPWVPPPLKLIGILIDKSKKTAVLERSDGETFYLGEGDTIAGVSIVEIRPKSVEYSFSGQRKSWSIE